MKRVSTILIYFILILFIPALLRARNNKFIIGFSSGYSFGIGKYFKEETKYEDHIYKHYLKPWLPLYLNLQYHFSEKWAVQVQIGGQIETETNESIWLLENYTDQYTYHRFTPIVFLDIVYKFCSFKNREISPYLSFGLGGIWEYWLLGMIFFGEPGETIWIFKTTVGIEYYLSSHLALDAGISSYINYPALSKKSIPVLISLNFGLKYKF